MSRLEASVTISPKTIVVRKNKPKTLPRLHEIKVDEIVGKGRNAVRTSQERIQKSKIVNRITRELIEASIRRQKNRPEST